MQLTPFCLMLSCLRVSPDRSQFFRYDTISLSCEGPLNSTGWKVKRKTAEGGIRHCSSGWGTTYDSKCIIGTIYPTDSGVYWCQSVDGEKSNGVNITITDRTVILESPALPVSEGATVTLHCKAEMKSTDHVFDFYKDDHHISSSSRGELTIQSASKSDEGLYMCGISGGVNSTSSWLAVDGSTHHSSGATDMRLLTGDITAFPASNKASFATSNFTSTPPAPSCSISIYRLICHLVVGILYLFSTILLGLIYRDRKRATQTVEERGGSNNVIMEVVV